MIKKLGEGDAKYTYGGKELDDETNLYYFNARYYDATIGRFINVDPIQDGTNWYVYCNNNPLCFTDPTGLADIATAIEMGKIAVAQKQGAAASSSVAAFIVIGAVFVYAVADELTDGALSETIEEGVTLIQDKVIEPAAKWTEKNVVIPAAVWTAKNVVLPAIEKVEEIEKEITAPKKSPFTDQSKGKNWRPPQNRTKDPTGQKVNLGPEKVPDPSDPENFEPKNLAQKIMTGAALGAKIFNQFFGNNKNQNDDKDKNNP